MKFTTPTPSRITLLPCAWLLTICCWPTPLTAQVTEDDPIAELQTRSAESNTNIWGHWGPDRDKYSSWTTHSNRLIPVYTFGLSLDAVSGVNSPYRDAQRLSELYGRLPVKTLNPQAEYFDQTDIYRLQKQAAEEGKKRIIVFVFDGLDWQTTRAAAIVRAGQVSYDSGRGSGLHFQDYRGAETDFGFFVSSPHNDGTSVNVDRQIVTNPGGNLAGGYDVHRGGPTPWQASDDLLYPIGKSPEDAHAYTDSAASATSLLAGIKTYNDAINVDFSGREAVPIARQLQAEGFAVGVVTSVPISHATPACAYANNVHRNDYQDLTRDLLGLPSVFHPGGLPGVDVLIGCGWGETSPKDGEQGQNFVPGNRYVTQADLADASVAMGGKYVIAQRTDGQSGSHVLNASVEQAIAAEQRLFGYFGVAGGHLPYRTANGDYAPVRSMGNPQTAQAEVYSPADLNENVNLSEMALAAMQVLDARSDRWWLMIEAGDVDWANHANNIDNSIGATLSGDDAFKTAVDWVEQHGGWDDTALILTADHGHYLVIEKPAMLTP